MYSLFLSKIINSTNYVIMKLMGKNNEKEFITIYILIDDKITLIETGPACSHNNLVEGIAKAGVGLSDIDYIVPTHIHLDHFGGE